MIIPEKDVLQQMLSQIQEIKAHALQMEARYADAVERTCPPLQPSARNLVHYRALRTFDIRALQRSLGQMGLSRLARAEGHVLASLDTAEAALQSLLNEVPLQLGSTAGLSIPEATAVVRTHTRELLGYRTEGRRARIMVTLPSEAAEDYTMVEALLRAGMNCARINCAHDGPEKWAQMIAHVRKAAEALGRRCQVAMDLAGPKIRTGALLPGPAVRRFKPKRDAWGQVVEPARIWIGPQPPAEKGAFHLPATITQVAALQGQPAIWLSDTRARSRELPLSDWSPQGVWAASSRTLYLENGSYLFTSPSMEKAAFAVSGLPAAEAAILLKPGDELAVYRDGRPGQNAQYSLEGEQIALACISCTAPEVFDSVRVGEPVLFDDGKIRAEIVAAEPTHFVAKVQQAKAGGSLLRADKGMNFPESCLQISGLTEKDRADLPFVSAHADVVNLSFVNSAADVDELLQAIDALGATGQLGVILKIETQAGFDQLPQILLAGMQAYPVGVMIARGDLAVECGWENIGRVQEEIQALCQAAHLPDIWATQVLENLAKKGIPSRAEITDAVMAQRAECVMLNKGPYILDAVRLLDRILKDMEPHQDKSAPLLPPMERAKGE